jgi:hypothetical protein
MAYIGGGEFTEVVGTQHHGAWFKDADDLSAGGDEESDISLDLLRCESAKLVQFVMLRPRDPASGATIHRP